MKITTDKALHKSGDQFAALLANAIIRNQLRSSAWLNRKFNAFSTRGKKCFVFLVGLLAVAFLTATSLFSFYQLPRLSQNFSSANIGRPSALPESGNAKLLTDSLTKNN